MTLTPTFMGAEPSRADAGKYAGIAAFEDEERLGLQFARDLSAEQKRKAIFSDSLLPDRLPPGRHQGVDGLMLSARQKNNTIIPYEGIRGADLAPQQRQALLDLTQCYLSTLPAGPLAARMNDVERHFAATHFCWAGGLDDDSPFYYRIQSPVVMIEFDHQSGVVLKNPEPQEISHPHHRPHAQRQRFRRGPVAPALRDGAPSPRRPPSPSSRARDFDPASLRARLIQVRHG